MTTNLAETIAGLEDALNQYKLTGRIDDIDAIESALAHLRSQEETVRRCVEICRSISLSSAGTDGKGGLHYVAERCRNAILAAHGLKEKT